MSNVIIGLLGWQPKMCCDSDLWPPNSNQFILVLLWIFVPNLKKFPQGVFEIMLHRKGTDVRTARKHNASSHVCIKKGHIVLQNNKSEKHYWLNDSYPTLKEVKQQKVATVFPLRVMLHKSWLSYSGTNQITANYQRSISHFLWGGCGLIMVGVSLAQPLCPEQITEPDI